MFSQNLVLDGCKFSPDSRYITIEKTSREMLPMDSIDRFEVETLLSILSLLSNKAIRIFESKKIAASFSFKVYYEFLYF